MLAGSIAGEPNRSFTSAAAMGRLGWSSLPQVGSCEQWRAQLDLLRTPSPLPYLSHREFARWKVNNLALERKDFFSLPLPLAPEFIRNIRLLGRRPSAQQITDSLIRKYGTHFLLAATLGGEC